MTVSLAVLASGLVTAIGYNSPASLAALRAGVSGVRSKAWPDHESGEQVRCARVSLPQRWRGVGLLADLVAPAIHECVEAAQPESIENIPLLIGVAHRARPGRPPELERYLLREIHDRLGIRGHSASAIYPSDQTGCARAMVEAQKLIRDGHARYAIVAGVDSFLERETFDAYVERRRLLTPANFNGFLPGEAGSAVLVGLGSGGKPALRISGWGEAHESATIEATKPLRGVALTQAIRAALMLASIGMERISFRVTDLSGEHYKFKEAMFALMRLDNEPRIQPLELWHPIEYLGEIGAAILPCILAWAWHAMRNGYAPGPYALCHIGSDDGARVALVVHAEASAEGQA